ncbi:MAG: riboflavin synthase [Eubacterium sp.]|nr:riboflavin synthase [Eubacterium sp.]
MFTGIVEEMGQIERIERGSQSAILHIQCKKVLEGTAIGDSIAVNGVCLTVTSLSANGYTADVMAETMERSSLGSLQKGSRVNLERAMAADGRFGGHIVAGHIDGTGRIQSITKDETAVWYQVAAAPTILRYVVEKGSITIDGISLTVAKVTDKDFSVSIIPHTQANTVLAERQVGDVVNLETDIIGKYVEKLLKPAESPSQPESKITMEFLMEHGF